MLAGWLMQYLLYTGLFGQGADMAALYIRRLLPAVLPIPDICHGHTDGVRGEKICHVEKFQIPAHDKLVCCDLRACVWRKF